MEKDTSTSRPSDSYKLKSEGSPWSFFSNIYSYCPPIHTLQAPGDPEQTFQRFVTVASPSNLIHVNYILLAFLLTKFYKAKPDEAQGIK